MNLELKTKKFMKHIYCIDFFNTLKGLPFSLKKKERPFLSSQRKINNNERKIERNKEWHLSYGIIYVNLKLRLHTREEEDPYSMQQRKSRDYRPKNKIK